jgi:hypothetical protein
MPTLVRPFLAVEILTFGLAALVHAGFLAHGLEHPPARIAESVIAAVLLASLAGTFIAAASSRGLGLAGQGFALFGTVVGLFTIALGIGPRTVFDLTLHAGMVTLLVVGLVLTARARS